VLHPLLLQIAVPLAVVGQSAPQPPQLLVSVLVSTQPVPQRM
jgi:hypothetical protein